MRNDSELNKASEDIISDDLLVSEEAIEAIIEEELAKSEAEIDTDLIDFCADLLLDIQDGKLSPVTAKIDAAVLPSCEIPKETCANEPPADNGKLKEIKKRKRYRRLGRSLLIAALVSMVCMFTLSASAKAFDFRIDDALLSVFNKDTVKLDFGQAKTQPEQYSDERNALVQELKENGISPVNLPEALINGDWQIGEITYDKQVSSNVATIEISNEKYKQRGGIVMTYFSDFPSDGFADIILESETGEQLTINGVDVLIIKQKKYTVVKYDDVNSQIRYSIMLPCSQEEAVTIMNTLISEPNQ